ncbi:50S ribosomal protein L21 [Candidatus Gracilibacteria bacterium]|nr:50S ribosomal protein L21 [Candidatus Gracilibacteria bacterium]
MIAIFKNGGKQYKCQKGDVITLEKIEKEVGTEIEIKKVLMAFDDKNVEVGTPFVKKTIVAKIIENGKGEKINVFKMKAKKRYSKKYGHRQPFTKIEILDIK